MKFLAWPEAPGDSQRCAQRLTRSLTLLFDFTHDLKMSSLEIGKTSLVLAHWRGIRNSPKSSR